MKHRVYTGGPRTLCPETAEIKLRTANKMPPTTDYIQNLPSIHVSHNDWATEALNDDDEHALLSLSRSARYSPWRTDAETLYCKRHYHDTITTLSRTHASLRLASEQVSSVLANRIA